MWGVGGCVVAAAAPVVVLVFVLLVLLFVYFVVLDKGNLITKNGTHIMAKSEFVALSLLHSKAKTKKLPTKLQ